MATAKASEERGDRRCCGRHLQQRLVLATLISTASAPTGGWADADLTIVDIRADGTPGLREHEVSLLRLLEAEPPSTGEKHESLHLSSIFLPSPFIVPLNPLRSSCDSQEQQPKGSEMANSKNLTAHNQSYKAHRNWFGSSGDTILDLVESTSGSRDLQMVTLSSPDPSIWRL
jgi:hypothetical protein